MTMPLRRLFRRLSHRNISTDDDESSCNSTMTTTRLQHRLSLSSRRRRLEGKHYSRKQQQRQPLQDQRPASTTDHDDSYFEDSEEYLVVVVEQRQDESVEVQRQSTKTTNKVVEGRGRVRFDLNVRSYQDELRNISSPVEWNRCWYYPETIQEFRVEARQEQCRLAKAVA